MGIAAANASSVKIGNYGALENAEKEDSYYFVQWVGEPYELNKSLDVNKIFQWGGLQASGIHCCNVKSDGACWKSRMLDSGLRIPVPR